MTRKGQKVKPGSLKGGKSIPSSKAKLGSGGRFKALENKLASKGAKNPEALAAALGRAKLGSKKMASLSEKGRNKK